MIFLKQQGKVATCAYTLASGLRVYHRHCSGQLQRILQMLAVHFVQRFLNDM